MASRRGRTDRPRTACLCTLVLLGFLVPTGDAGGAKKGRSDAKDQAKRNPQELRIVDCLLPGQVRQLGRNQSYVSRRRPLRTSVLDCEIRGGEYVAYDRADYRTALRVWLETAEAGDADAQYYVGEIYERGLGAEPDFERAAEWYGKAAKKGHRQAQINLGFLYEKGQGVVRDPHRALEWYRTATGVSGIIMLDSEVESIRQQLVGANRELKTASAATLSLEHELETARRQLDAERDSTRQSGAEAAELKQRVAKLEADLGRDRARIARIQESIQSFDIAGPTIEIIDVEATRSVPSAREEARDEVVGRVEAPAGLAQFRVDDTDRAVGEDGFFRFSPPSTRFTLVAVDLAGKRIEIVHDMESQARSRQTQKRRATKFGNYHALVIGNSDYQSMPDLQTAAGDATAIKELLEDRFRFRVTLLVDADYFDILVAFTELRKELKKNDNLVVYFAGHGELDSSTGLGYWLPVDAEPGARTNWISSREISQHLQLLPARHVLIIADSCYAGALTRSALGRLEGSADGDGDRWVGELVEKRSRTALTSGGLAPVLDSGGGGRSLFARSLLEALGQVADPMETYRLWSSVKARVMYETRSLRLQQVPEYAPIQFAGHEGGEFFFVPSGG